MLKMIKAWQCTEVRREAEAARFIGILVSKLWEHWINAHKIRPWVVPLLLVCCAWHEWKPQQKKAARIPGHQKLLHASRYQNFPQPNFSWALFTGTTHKFSSGHLFIWFFFHYRFPHICQWLYIARQKDITGQQIIMR